MMQRKAGALIMIPGFLNASATQFQTLWHYRLHSTQFLGGLSNHTHVQSPILLSAKAAPSVAPEVMQILAILFDCCDPQKS